MGTDISVTFYDVHMNVVSPEFIGALPFDYRDYGVYGFLAGVRNYSAVEPISEPRGVPDWGGAHSEYHDYGHGYSWLSISELAAHNYNQIIEDRRVTIDGDGGRTCIAGQGVKMVLSEFLGERFLDDIKRCSDNGVFYIVFSFDS